MNANSIRIMDDLAALSRRLSPEAAYYWERHEPRYRHLLATLDQLAAEGRSFSRILDVGMGFQTLLLTRRFPSSQVDVLGVYDDERYRPAPGYIYHNINLNLAAREHPVSALAGEKYDLIVFLEVLEHLYTPPALVFSYLAAQLAPGGLLLASTPNAAWLKNRLKLLRGKNPYELLKADLGDMGHIREYTADELAKDLDASGLMLRSLERRGLYRFNNPKDNFYCWLADHLHPSLRRTLFAVAEKK